MNIFLSRPIDVVVVVVAAVAAAAVIVVRGRGQI